MARRFTKSRGSVYALASKSLRVRQAIEAFPVLGYYASTRPENDKDVFIDMVNRDESIKIISEKFGIPWCLRKIKPMAASVIELRMPEFFQQNERLIYDFLPKTSMEKFRWLVIIKRIYDITGNDEINWFAKNLATKEKLKNLIPRSYDLADYIRASVTGNLAENLRPFNANMKWDGVVKASRGWHQAFANWEIARGYRVEESNEPFPEPWLPAKNNGEYQIVPLIEPKDLAEEGQAMHHCVSSYSSRVRSGHCYIYSVRNKDGKRIATLELGKEKFVDLNIFKLNQLRGHCNAVVDNKIKEEIYKWIKQNVRSDKSEACYLQIEGAAE